LIGSLQVFYAVHIQVYNADCIKVNRFPGPSSKARIRHRQKPPIYFWRDKIGREIDLLVEWGEALHASEIKSGQTVASDAFDRLIWWSHMAGQPLANASLNCLIWRLEW
jgi:hypothetical protein